LSIASKRERLFDFRNHHQQQQQQPQHGYFGSPQKSASIHIHSTISKPKLISQFRNNATNLFKVNSSETVVMKPPLKVKVKIPIRRVATRGAEHSTGRTLTPTATSVANWTCQEVSRWVCKTCLEHGMPLPFPTDKFLVSGRALLFLSKSEFVSRSKACGEMLYLELQRIKKGKLEENFFLNFGKSMVFVSF
jgi:hypothetical protein